MKETRDGSLRRSKQETKAHEQKAKKIDFTLVQAVRHRSPLEAMILKSDPLKKERLHDRPCFIY